MAFMTFETVPLFSTSSDGAEHTHTHTAEGSAQHKPAIQEEKHCCFSVYSLDMCSGGTEDILNKGC